MAKNLISTKGIVLREVMIGESDKLLTVLTPDLGRISVRCRGVRALKSRRFASAQLYCYSDLQLSEKDGIYALEEGDVLESFFGLRDRLEAIACAGYFAELLLTSTVEGEGDEEILRLTLNCFYYLATRTDIPVTLPKAVFEARLVALLGMMPDLSSCSECGEPVGVGWLDLAGGVGVCSSCALQENPTGESKTLLPLDPDLTRLFHYVSSAPLKKIFSFRAEAELLEGFGRIAEQYLLYHLGRKFDTLTFLHSIL